MDTTRAPTDDRSGPEPLDAFLERYGRVLRRVFRNPTEDVRRHLVRGLPPSELREVLAQRPLSVFIPARHGGRGEHVHEGLAMLERTAYDSLAMSLTLGINGALFLQPVAKYGSDAIHGPIFERFLDHQNMGGLMMTEPGYGSDALSMQTSWTQEGDRYRIHGTKHWAGLTGLAAHRSGEAVVVEERFENLGLYAIPYGRNRVDVSVPAAQRLTPKRSGLKMMLDLLHRSRIQFPGMALGFLRRMADEAMAHVHERQVGGRSLLAYDQVQRRIARLQASVTVASAMCVFASSRAGVDQDLSKEGLPANIVKATVTDRMQEGAQSVLQLMGAKGYRLDHISGRGLVDSRPFQIFEGSNDILYEQIATATLQAMRKAKEPRLAAFLAATDWASRAADRLEASLDVRIDTELPQR